MCGDGLTLETGRKRDVPSSRHGVRRLDEVLGLRKRFGGRSRRLIRSPATLIRGDDLALTSDPNSPGFGLNVYPSPEHHDTRVKGTQASLGSARASESRCFSAFDRARLLRKPCATTTSRIRTMSSVRLATPIFWYIRTT